MTRNAAAQRQNISINPEVLPKEGFYDDVMMDYLIHTMNL